MDASKDKSLDFPLHKLYGRTNELKQLHDAFTRNREIGGARMTLIAGYSGTGKSRLVQEFREELHERLFRSEVAMPLLFLKGIFEDIKTNPFSALQSAFSDYCSQLAQGEEEELSRVRERIRKLVGSEGRVLTDIFPDFVRLIGEQEEASPSSTNKHAFNRLKFLFQGLVHVVCSGDRPVILFLDDLHRADSASLDLIMAIMTDKALNNLLIIGAIRSNEVGDSHHLNTSLTAMEEKGCCIERISLSELPRQIIGTFISDTLHLDPEKTQSLTNAVYDKTKGNVFFTMQSLEQLKQRGILVYSMNSLSWEWDVNRIVNEMSISDNVVDVLMLRIKYFPDLLQRALGVAALLRLAFDIRTVHDFMKREQEHQGMDQNDLARLFEVAVTAGLLKHQVGSTVYEFAHDRIQQAAYSLLPSVHSWDDLKVRIGRYLAGLVSSGGGEDWMLFVAANHLNSSLRNPKEDHCLYLARLNLNVGERAISLSAFLQASSYFQKGVEALERVESHWQSYHGLSLKLYRAAADIDLSIGNFYSGWQRGHELLRNATSLSDKLPTYLSFVDGLGNRGRHTEALYWNRRVLQLMGEFPKRHHHSVHVLKDLWITKRALRRLSDEDFLSLPRMNDPNKLMAMQFYTRLSYRAFLCSNNTLTLFGCLRQLLMTLQFGVCGDTAQALAAFGLLLSGKLGDHKLALRMARLAHGVFDVTNEKRLEALTLQAVAGYVEAWSVPLSKVLQSYERAYRSGMETGDFECGFMAWSGSHNIAFAAGMPLGPIEVSGGKLVQQMQQYNVEAILRKVKEVRVLVLHLTGTAIDHDWRAECYEEERMHGQNNLSNYFPRVRFYCSRMQLAYYFDDIPLADRLVTKLKAVSSADTSFNTVSHLLFFSGLIAMSMASIRGKPIYHFRARKSIKAMKSLVNKQGFNILHKHYILKAQYGATFSRRRRKTREIKAAFDEAISAAARAGFIQDAAIACELAGDYFLRVEDTFWARHYYTNSCFFFRDWGASAKVDHLLQKRRRYIDASEVCSRRRVSLLRRQYWVEGEACQKHNNVDLKLLNGSSIKLSLEDSAAFSAFSMDDSFTDTNSEISAFADEHCLTAIP